MYFLAGYRATLLLLSPILLLRTQRAVVASRRATNLATHRVGRVLSLFSSRRNWDSPTPFAAGECALPPFGPGGGRAHSLAGEGLGGPNSDEGTYTVMLMRTTYPSSQMDEMAYSEEKSKDSPCRKASILYRMPIATHRMASLAKLYQQSQHVHMCATCWMALTGILLSEAKDDN